MELLTVDESGRVVLPQEIREQLGLNTQTRLSLEVKDGQLILKPILDRNITDTTTEQEPEIYYENGVLVVKAEAVGNVERTIEQLREERIKFFSP
jgi:AbrB family looped-hinge helix DNA binding protein